jgi:hypothetical protein
VTPLNVKNILSQDAKLAQEEKKYYFFRFYWIQIHIGNANPGPDSGAMKLTKTF